MGPYSVYIDVTPSPIYVNQTVTLTLIATRTDTGEATALDATFEAVAPSGATQQLRTARIVGGTEATFAPRERGNHTLRVHVREASASYDATTYLDVYPDLAYRIQAFDPTQDVYTGYPTQITIRVLNMANRTSAPELVDLTASIERWNDDHTRLIATTSEPVAHDGPDGTWTVKHAFAEPGMYHLRFHSDIGRFNETDIPLLHTYATAPPDGLAPASRPTPDVSTPILLVTLCLLAMRQRR